ncbi:MAG: Txe/YoeB family addiction module toxin [Paludibacteraceae bacterium]|nr:Txe/YoeB family addiction module toxin [Paludibacteraceae bacterium]
MKFFVEVKEKAQRDLKRLLDDEPKAYRKALALIEELYSHPKTGTGHPEQLKNYPCTWSRHITKKHRLVYEVHDMQVIVLVLTAYGHYDDR